MIKPIEINNISIEFPQKICFEGFSSKIYHGDRIAITGDNGSGKTMLLKALAGLLKPSSGEVILDKAAAIGYVPQTVSDYDSLSGGERFSKALSEAMALNPDILLLDEPTNHLDRKNRDSLLGMLKYYGGALVIVSHDRELLNACASSIWNISENKITVFKGGFDDFTEHQSSQRASLEKQLFILDKEKKASHQSLMKEQQRAKNSKERGQKQAREGKWAPIIAGLKKSASQNTAGRLSQNISSKKEEINQKLSSLRLTEIIKPKFSITTEDAEAGVILSVTEGSAGYGETTILKGINFSLNGTGRLAVCGNNGSGKTTLIKAILSAPSISKTGFWNIPKQKDIGYLDQHYGNLDSAKTVLESVKALLPDYTHAELRNFLNDFLFRKNEEVNASVKNLSGGEKARLSLALITAKTPKLLILDEVTNNIDIKTKEHIISVLKDYPAAIIVISHEADFLGKISVDSYFYTENNNKI